MDWTYEPAVTLRSCNRTAATIDAVRRFVMYYGYGGGLLVLLLVVLLVVLLVR